VDIEIDMPEWFDNSIGWFFNWGMTPGYFGFPNIWFVAGGVLIFLLIAGLIRIRNVRRREDQLAREYQANGGTIRLARRGVLIS
jgi:hypothetical protein